MANSFAIPQYSSTIIKVIGVGGGGGNAVEHMFKQGIDNVSFVICNTDAQALMHSTVPNKVQLGKSGLGAGNIPEKGREAAEDSIDAIAELFNDETKMVFITAGMGGGTGTGAAPVVARVARDHGMLTIGIVTIPFVFEGQRKILKAIAGAEEMSKYVDALLVINNERLTEIYPNLNFMTGFAKADDTLTTAARGISELITNNNHVINIDFNDVDTTLRNGGAAVISIGYGEGEHRVQKALDDALNSPLLRDRDIMGSKKILFNLYVNPDADQEFVMHEVNDLSEFIAGIDENVDVIWGLAHDKSLGNKVKITLLAAGFSSLTGAGDEVKSAANAVAADLPIRPKPVDRTPEQKLEGIYGAEKTAEIQRQRDAHKFIILTPEMMDDDSILEQFEKNPTFSRDQRMVKELANASKAQTRDDADAPKPNTHSGTDSELGSTNSRITFN